MEVVRATLPEGQRHESDARPDHDRAPVAAEEASEHGGGHAAQHEGDALWAQPGRAEEGCASRARRIGLPGGRRGVFGAAQIRNQRPTACVAPTAAVVWKVPCARGVQSFG